MLTTAVSTVSMTGNQSLGPAAGREVSGPQWEDSRTGSAACPEEGVPRGAGDSRSITRTSQNLAAVTDPSEEAVADGTSPEQQLMADTTENTYKFVMLPFCPFKPDK